MLSLFPFLETFSVSYNEFSGAVPEAYRRMSNLKNLELHYNFLTGTISANLYKANVLQNYNIGGNLFHGTVARTEELTLAIWQGLTGFHIFDNLLTGPFPTEIGELRSLGKLWKELSI